MKPPPTRAVLLAVVSLALLVGCATVGAGDAAKQSEGQKLDPWETWNRKVFGFNEAVDANVLKPVATGYRNVVPGFIRTGIGNFFANAADAWSAINLFLQGRVEDGFSDTIRFATNTVFGWGGVLDVATDFGLDHHYEDLGQTLGKWGVGAGAYIVWPLLGPSSVRESFALPLDRAATPAVLFREGAKQGTITVVQTINTRAEFLDAGRVLDEIALDKYSFVRDAYLARRRSLVYDGEPPPEDDDVTPPAPAGAASAPAAPASAPAR